MTNWSFDGCTIRGRSGACHAIKGRPFHYSDGTVDGLIDTIEQILIVATSQSPGESLRKGDAR